MHHWVNVNWYSKNAREKCKFGQEKHLQFDVLFVLISFSFFCHECFYIDFSAGLSNAKWCTQFLQLFFSRLVLTWIWFCNFFSSIYSFGKKPSLVIFSATKFELTSIRRMHAKIKYGNFRWKSNLALKRDSFPMAFGGTNCWHRLTYRSA